MSANIGSNFYIGYLAQALTEGGAETTVYVDRITTLTGETIATADFSDLSYGILTVNPDGDGVTSFPENISFTGIDATNVSFTTCVRGLSSKNVTPVTANKRYYPIGTPVVISWGVHSWALLKSYVDTAVAGFTSFYAPGTAGETVAAGTPVYLKTADGCWWKTSSGASATSENVMLGIAQGAGTAGAFITNGVLVMGYDSNQSGMTIGATQYLADTSGTISGTPGTKTVSIGVARTATTLYFNPHFSQQLTNDQINALAGDNGTPSSTNKYVTQSGRQIGAEVYAADSVGTDAYAVTLSPVPAAYVTGMVVNFKAGTVNTGAATLNVNTLGAITIKKNHDQDLTNGDIESGQIVTVIYDSTGPVFQMQSQTAASTTADIQTFTSTGANTWTAPSGAKKVLVQLWGAGGSGGNANSNTASGGGGGMYYEGWFDVSALGSSQTVTIGTGGAMKTTDGNGNAGGSTSFGTLLIATGGGAGTGAGNVSTAGGNGGSKFGNINFLYGGGASGAVGQDGVYSAGGGGTTDASGTTFAGGNSEWGGAGGGAANSNGSSVSAGGVSVNGGNGGAGVTAGSGGVAGSVPGGGGGGTVSGTGSGAGGNGKAIVTTFF